MLKIKQIKKFVPVISAAMVAALSLTILPLTQSQAYDAAAPAMEHLPVLDSAINDEPEITPEVFIETKLPPVEVINSELLAATTIEFAKADQAAAHMAEVSPNLRRKIAKTSGVVANLINQLDPENQATIPEIAKGTDLFTLEEIADSTTQAIETADEITAIDPLIKRYDDESAQLRVALAVKIAELADHINTANDIEIGVNNGKDVIEGTKQFSHTGVLLLKQFEGLSLTGYELGDGMCTIGYGIATPIDEAPDCLEWTITEHEAENLLADEVQTYANAVAEHFTRPLTQNQFDALTIFTYNVGTGIYQRYNWSPEPEDQRITDAMSLYVNPPQFREGLTMRRNAEIALFYS